MKWKKWWLQKTPNNNNPQNSNKISSTRKVKSFLGFFIYWFCDKNVTFTKQNIFCGTIYDNKLYNTKRGGQMTRILLVEDDKSIVTNLTEYLIKEGYTVKSVSGQKDALQLVEREKFDLVLLDISLSDGNGFAVCKAIKSDYHIPVIFLTASGDEYSTVTGFELGADDYIVKPFRPRELVIRIKNILRLTSGTNSVIRIGNILVDMDKGIVSKNGKDLHLSALEYRLLLVFLGNRGIVLSRTQLLDAIWDIAGDFVNDNTLTVYIKRLREKLEEDPQNPEIIKTVRGLGYKVDVS